MAEGQSLMDKVGLGLSAFGAGVQGRGMEFNQQLDLNRKQAMLQDASMVNDALTSGDVGRARDLLVSRVGAINKLGGDPSDTLGVLNKIESGDVKGALQDTSSLLEYAYDSGFLTRKTPANRDTKVVGDSLIDGQTGEVIRKLDVSELPGKAEDRDLRARALAIDEQKLEESKNKLSAGLEKTLLESSDRAVEAQQESNSYENLANDFERLKLEGGLKTTFVETLKGILGSQDDVTEFRRKFNNVRLSEGLKNLPPGAASDTDVKQAFKGVPPDNASPEQVVSFLRGAARLARLEAGFNQFKSDFISNKSTGKGLNQAWRKSIESPVLKRSVSVAEIYETAQNRQITPEEVIKQLGIDGGLF